MPCRSLKPILGGILTQLDDNGVDSVVAYFSKKLSETEQKYTANEGEMIGVLYFLNRFRGYLEGSSFEVFTDNQMLNNFFTGQSMNLREVRWI